MRRESEASRAIRAMRSDLPLRNVRVVDITVVWAGPHCTQLLAEWGAEVIRTEPLLHTQSSTRDTNRTITKEMVQRARAAGGYAPSYPNDDPGQRPWNRTAAFNSHARNKLSMTVDFHYPEGREAFLDLIKVSDVVVENNVPETIERAHVTYEELREVNPSIIMLRMPAYGLSGPYKNYRSFGTHMEGMTGHHHLRGYPNMDPSMIGDAFTADAAAGVMGAFAVMLALRYRRRTGRGQQIELAQAENFLPYLAESLMDFAMNGRETEPQGNHHPSHAPHNVYPVEGPDRWIAIDIGDDASWRALREVLGAPAWMDEPRFADTLSRWHHRDELDPLLAEETKRWEPYALWQKLIAAGVIAGPVQDERDAYNCPQLNARGFFEPLTHPEFGTYRYPGLVFKFLNTPNHLRRHPVRLGEDNDYVYHDLLDLPSARYEALVRQGQIGMDFPKAAVPVE
jgi:crotonobetainyl-CoA:carnitine CoA-transferase CaiB-like acyl-CoA transferase